MRGARVLQDDPVKRRRIKVGIAELGVADEPALISTSGLGSCIGCALHDPTSEIGGLVHTMLPDRAGSTERNPSKFTGSGIERLIEAMIDRGASRRGLRAVLVGGSAMLNFANEAGSIGDRNVELAREVLIRRDVPIEAEDVGGNHGRFMQLDTVSGIVTVTSGGETTKLSSRGGGR